MRSPAQRSQWLDALSAQRSRAWRCRRDVRLELPSLAILARDVLIGLGAANGLHVGIVPDDLFASAIGDVSELHGLGEWTGIFKVTSRLRSALARFGPLAVMPDGCWNRTLRRFDILKALVGQKCVTIV